MSSSLLREALQSASHLLFPRLCEGCRQPLILQEDTLCMSCTFQLPQTEFYDKPDNEAAIRIAGRIPYQHATAFAYFTTDGLLQHLLHRLKYSGRKSIGIFLGRQAGYALKPLPWIASVDAIVPVPLHPRKESTRGYNQSELIARGMSEVLGISTPEHTLVRVRNTVSQTKTRSREERVTNMKDAFAVHSKAMLADKHVLLVDDVLTTGATLESASQALMQVP